MSVIPPISFRGYLTPQYWTGDTSARDLCPDQDVKVQPEAAEVTQLREELLVETGCDSYNAYLEKNEKNTLLPTIDIDEYEAYREAATDENGIMRASSIHCTVLDMSLAKRQLPDLTLRGDNLSAPQTMKILRNPSQDVAVQIVLWNLANGSSISRDWANVLCLGLKLDRSFCEDLEAKCDWRWSRKNEAWPAKSLRSTYDFKKQLKITVTFPHDRSELSHVPVVVIAGDLDHVSVDCYYWYRSVAAQLSENLCDLQVTSWSAKNNHKPKILWSLTYAELLNISINQNELYADADKNPELLLCLLPPLQLDLIWLRDRIKRCRYDLTRMEQYMREIDPIKGAEEPCGNLTSTISASEERLPATLYQSRIDLRRVVEEFEDQSPLISRFLSSKIVCGNSKSAIHQQYEKDKADTIRQARRLDAEICDLFHLQNSQWALTESKKSIQLSNYQIQEGKRGRSP